jgi:hypothetical protein
VALAKLGTDEAVDFLEQQVLSWLDPGSGARVGMEAWNALLMVDNPAVVFSLTRLEPKLAPFQALQAYGLRIRFGERDLVPKLRSYLDAETYPSAGTRTLALQLLGELGDWQSVLASRDSGELKMEESLVGLLRRPEAVAAGIGSAELDDLIEHGLSEDIRYNALLAQIERGHTQLLDPYLRQLREFPTGRGSVEALHILARDGFADERSATILISRWEFAEGAYRTDILRALTRSGSAAGARFLADRAMDPEEDLQLRETALTILANFGPQTVPLFLEIYAEQPDVWTATRVIPGLGKYATDPAAREQLLLFASSPQVDDRVRHLVIGMMPRIFRTEAASLLLALRADEPRGDVVRYIDRVLSEYF